MCCPVLSRHRLLLPVLEVFVHARYLLERLTARGGLPFSPLEAFCLVAAAAAGIAWWSDRSAPLLSLVPAALFGGGIGLLASGLCLAMLRDVPAPLPGPVVLPDPSASVRVVLDDAHLVGWSVEPGRARIVVQSGSQLVERIDPDGRPSPLPPGVSVPSRVAILLPAQVPVEARAACDSLLPGTVTVLGRVSGGPVPTFDAEQLVVDFPLWSEAYL